jgi:hypothetical protein
MTTDLFGQYAKELGFANCDPEILARASKRYTKAASEHSDERIGSLGFASYICAAAKEIGYSPQQIADLISKGRLNFLHTGSHLDDYIESDISF